MKTCTYCGAESKDATDCCRGCGAALPLAYDSSQRSRPLFRVLRLTKRSARLVLATAVVTSVLWALPWSDWLKPVSFRPVSMAGYLDSYFVAGEYPPTTRFTSGDTATIYYADSDWQPTIVASINGVTNTFIVDSGAACPMLSMNGASSFKVPLSPMVGTGTTRFPVSFPVETRVARNVTVEIAPGVTVHWPWVVVEMTNHPWAGLFDYRTLAALNAVVDVKKRTITVSVTKTNVMPFNPAAIAVEYGRLVYTNMP